MRPLLARRAGIAPFPGAGVCMHAKISAKCQRVFCPARVATGKAPLAGPAGWYCAFSGCWRVHARQNQREVPANASFLVVIPSMFLIHLNAFVLCDDLVPSTRWRSRDESKRRPHERLASIKREFSKEEIDLPQTPIPATIPTPRRANVTRYSEVGHRMFCASPWIGDDSQRLALNSTDLETHKAERWLARATWAFVGLGVALRLMRYLMDYPLWWDEAFVAVNFIRRDYIGLLRPLDYGQVCSILFLWSELTFVKLLGFSEWSLRLFPLACAVASVLLFRHAASRVVRGVPLLLAVAIFATSFHPIVHAADVKPYASDLLAALILLAMAVEWRRAPERAGWIWALAAAAPICLALSHPAIFVAAGTFVGLAPAVVFGGRRGVRIAHAAFGLSTVGTFALLYLVFTHAQSAANLTAMQVQWAAAFPPLRDPLALVKWLATDHTGSMFAYPCGGERGASSLTFLLFAAGAAVLWRQGPRVTVLICLAPFGIALAAAAIGRYPYGGPVPHGSPARVVQYMAPSICLLAGVGATALLTCFRDPRFRFRALRIAVVSLAAIGIIPLAADAFHPYRALHAQRAREFARQFWPEFVHDADTLCLRWDLGIGAWDSTNLNVAVYLCNQMIYSPRRWHPGNLPERTVAPDRPLRCVLPLSEPTDSQVAAWLQGMMKSHHLNAHRTLAVEMAEPGAKPRIEHYHVYEFVPRDVARQTNGHGSWVTVQPPVTSALELMHLPGPER